jgi:hypothetical protein
MRLIIQMALEKWGSTTFMDGTHNVLTSLVVRIQENEGFVCAWFVHSKKTASTFTAFLSAVSKAAPNWKPKKFVLDFEIAERLAVLMIFPNSNITLCYFHLHQSVHKFCKTNQISEGIISLIHKQVKLLQSSRSRVEFDGFLIAIRPLLQKKAPLFWSYFSSNYVVNGMKP